MQQEDDIAGKPHRWSAGVTRHSDALDLREAVFASHDPRKIANALKRAADTSRRRRSSSFRAAMSTLTFYIDRAEKNLPRSQKKVLEQAKVELRHACGR